MTLATGIGAGHIIGAYDDVPDWHVLQCDLCRATWAGPDGDPCHWCEMRVASLGAPAADRPPESSQGDEDSPWLDWPTFWADDHSEETWALYPLIPEGRCVSLYAPAKAGKSTILLAACAAAATGRSVFGFAPRPPVDVAYVDLEMTDQDLQQRLLELGYQPEDDLSRLHYALHPRWGPLDTPDGAYGFVEDLKAAGVTVVVIDTYSRAVTGAENDADTTRAFYRLCGTALKREGIAWLRADHSGKDLTLATRGSSAKLDDVDVVWQLTRGDDGIAIKRTHSRIGWVPAEINLTKQEDDDGVVTYVVTEQRGYGQGTKELVAELDRLGVNPFLNQRKTREALKIAGIKVRNLTLCDAMRFRRNDDTGITGNQDSDRLIPDGRSAPASGALPSVHPLSRGIRITDGEEPNDDPFL